MDYQESHKILYILNKDSIESLLVYRAKRYNSGLLNIAQKLTKIEYISNEKKLPCTNSLSSIDSYFEIKEDFNKMILCEYICEVIHKVEFDQINYNLLYTMVDTLLQRLKTRKDILLLFIQFKIKMLYFYGLNPDFKQCSICGSSNIFGLSIKNGCECEMHKSIDNIGTDLTKIIYLLYKDQFNIEDLDFDVLKLINNTIEQFYKNNFFMEFKSEILLKTTLSLSQ